MDILCHYQVCGYKELVLGFIGGGGGGGWRREGSSPPPPKKHHIFPLKKKDERREREGDGGKEMESEGSNISWGVMYRVREREEKIIEREREKDKCIHSHRKYIIHCDYISWYHFSVGMYCFCLISGQELLVCWACARR